ncbi:hypothetical protein [Photobacterium lutimaris]|uniref:Uncharacterized protein n=1 Tax=Photobacterium lutimaris TaxID=388278 RepID=A0A2T3J4T8_9GAMM|nr:hypothetical protein [Photobacterium lutimaris]PSU36295.1 hypothetical protein C9I99_04660 [Photobacterium lutimaris]TDR74820.1 hypothetical protein DFP78_106151 [Photobacterium lutimaris]
MKSLWNKIKYFLTTPYGKAYLVFITLTKLYLVYKWALDHVKDFGGEVFDFIGASVLYGEALSAIVFTVLCGYYTVKAVINIFKSPPKTAIA